MSTFGKKPRKDWNAQDSARNSMLYMLEAQARSHRQRAENIKARMAGIIGGVCLALCLFVVQALVS